MTTTSRAVCANRISMGWDNHKTKVDSTGWKQIKKRAMAGEKIQSLADEFGIKIGTIHMKSFREKWGLR